MSQEQELVLVQIGQCSGRCDCRCLEKDLRCGHSPRSGRCTMRNVRDPWAGPDDGVLCEDCRKNCNR